MIPAAVEAAEQPNANGAGATTAAVVARRFRIIVTAGPDRGLARICDLAEFAIGTERGNQLVLRDPTVAQRHCLLTATRDGFLLRDLGSSKGTWLGGYRVESAYLASDAVIRIGETTVRFDCLGENRDEDEPLSPECRWGRVLGGSMTMRRMFALLPRIASSQVSVLLEGETGTGKGLLAESIHQASPRSGGPFVVVDCSAIAPTLIEAELFGHERGAFTGAHTARSGAFQAAHGGTLFLDEIGELPLELQPKFLRALEERQVKRIGSVEPIKVDVRVIAATNRDLRQEVSRGRFRSDLFYRLYVVRVRIPPLRERVGDIPLLVTHLYRQLPGRASAEAPAELVAALARRDWPGNVRELRSAVERAVLMDDPEPWLDASGEPQEVALAARPGGDDEGSLSFRVAKERAINGWERVYLEALVRRARGNLSRAARVVRMDRNYLRELLRRHGIRAHEEEE